MSKEHHYRREEVGAARLLEVLSSDNFQKSLGLAAKETKKSGRETRINVLIDSLGDLCIPKVEIGGLGQVGDSKMEDTLTSFIDIDMDCWYERLNPLQALLITLHFHPDADVRPSEGDLEHYLDPLAKIYAYSIISSVDQKGNIRALVIKKPIFPLIKEDIDEYLAQHPLDSSEAELSQALARIGLKAFIIEFIKEGKQYRLLPESIRKIEELGKSELHYFDLSQDD